MRKIAKKTSALILLLLPIAIMAQTDSAAAQTGGGFFSKLPVWLPIVAGAAYEILVRLVPTKNNWSVLGLVVNLLQTVFPNRSSDPTKTQHP